MRGAPPARSRGQRFPLVSHKGADTCWLAAETNSFRCRSTVRTAQTSCPGRNAARSNPTECRNCNHWHSCQSVRRPGTFFMWAFTKQGRMPRCSRISNSGIQYTPYRILVPQRKERCTCATANETIAGAKSLCRLTDLPLPIKPCHWYQSILAEHPAEQSSQLVRT